MTRYSKAAQTEASGEEEREDADVTDDEEEDGRPEEETDRTEILPKGNFLSRVCSLQFLIHLLMMIRMTTE